MSFEITKKEDGFDVLFKFSKSTAKVKITITDTENVWYVESETDGYHWLHYWMTQDPESSGVLELSHAMETEKNRQSMESLGFYYEREDKETCHLTFGEEVTEDTISRFAQFMEPRFALREKRGSR